MGADCEVRFQFLHGTGDKMAALTMVCRTVRAVARPCGVLFAKTRHPCSRTVHTLPSGTFPVMLTPFNEDKSIDWEALDGSFNIAR